MPDMNGRRALPTAPATNFEQMCFVTLQGIEKGQHDLGGQLLAVLKSLWMEGAEIILDSSLPPGRAAITRMITYRLDLQHGMAKEPKMLVRLGLQFERAVGFLQAWIAEEQKKNPEPTPEALKK